MSDSTNSTWPFEELSVEEGLDISKIFGSSNASSSPNPFEAPAEQPPQPPKQTQPPEQPQPPEQHQPASDTPPQQPPVTSNVPPEPPPAPAAEQVSQASPAAAAPKESEPKENTNPIAAAFAEKHVENTRKGLLEKPPVFAHRGAEEAIEDPSITFEELRIRKSEDFPDLEEGKYVSWIVEYCGIRKEVKDPKGTTVVSMKETIERSREFLDALKKSKSKEPKCYVKPKITGKSKGTAAYRGTFRTLEEARESDKVICLIPSNDGRFYELRKTEQGEFIAPKNKVAEYQEIRAGFLPALPLVPMSLMGRIIAFFRSFMSEHEEFEAMAVIYWDKEKSEFFAYVPRQVVTKEHIDADLRDCPYDDEHRYIRYAEIHSHNSMEAFFSSIDDQGERDTGLYLVLGELDRFYPDIKARFFCGGAFVPLDPAQIIEGLEQPYPMEWDGMVTCRNRKKSWEMESPYSRRKQVGL